MRGWEDGKVRVGHGQSGISYTKRQDGVYPL